jgi:AcrR family transcriptional regulator
MMATVRRAHAAENDRRVLAAARDVFARLGYDAPVAAIAQAAGVGMGSLYRRYGGKDELLADACLKSMQELIEIASAASGIDDLIRQAVAARVGAFGGVAGQVVVSDEMIRAAVTSQDRAAAVLRSAQAAGEIRTDVTVVDVLRLIELFSRGPRFDLPTEARLLALALDGLRPSGRQLPKPATSLRKYRERWSPKRPPA